MGAPTQDPMFPICALFRSDAFANREGLFTTPTDKIVKQQISHVGHVFRHAHEEFEKLPQTEPREQVSEVVELGKHYPRTNGSFTSYLLYGVVEWGHSYITSITSKVLRSKQRMSIRLLLKWAYKRKIIETDLWEEYQDLLGNGAYNPLYDRFIEMIEDVARGTQVDIRSSLNNLEIFLKGKIKDYREDRLKERAAFLHLCKVEGFEDSPDHKLTIVYKLVHVTVEEMIEYGLLMEDTESGEKTWSHVMRFYRWLNLTRFCLLEIGALEGALGNNYHHPEILSRVFPAGGTDDQTGVLSGTSMFMKWIRTKYGFESTNLMELNALLRREKNEPIAKEFCGITVLGTLLSEDFVGLVDTYADEVLSKSEGINNKQKAIRGIRKLGEYLKEKGWIEADTSVVSYERYGFGKAF